MPLILAIDSDRRQSEQLAALMRKSLKVELVQATSAGEGLHALQERVPDLILTSPLLSPFDDGVLDEYLRELGTQAAHVQTVRIPVLSAVSKPSARSLFSLGKKKTPSTAPDGCDPKVFADEIAQYLARAQERRASKSAAPSVTTSTEARSLPAVIESTVHQPIEPPHEDDPIVREFGAIDGDYSTGREDEDEQTPIYQPVATIQTFDIPEEPEPVAFRHTEPVASEPAPVASDPEPIIVRPMSILNLNEPMVISQARPKTSDEAPVPARTSSIVRDPDPIVESEPESLESSSHHVSIATKAHESIDTDAPVDAHTLIDMPAPIEAHASVDVHASVEMPASIEEHDPEPIVVNPAPTSVTHAAPSRVDVSDKPHRPATAPITSFETALAAIRAAWAGPTQPNSGSTTSTAAPRTAARVDGTPSVARELPATPAAASPRDAQTPATVAPVRPTQVEVDLTGDIDALEHIDRQEPGEQTDAADDSSARRRSPKARKNGARTPTAMPRTANGSAVQDEWGMFDPNKCGFSALVDKLDEVADPHDHPARTTKVRVISIG